LLSQGAKQDPARQKAFKQTLEDIFRQKSLAQWQVIFADKDACVEPVLKFSEACDNEQLKARGMIVSVPHSDGSSIDQIAHPIKMSLCQPQYQYGGVKLGEHNDQILDELEIHESVKEALIASKAMG
jgi:alpha-methylacyl-CoA racemase